MFLNPPTQGSPKARETSHSTAMTFSSRLSLPDTRDKENHMYLNERTRKTSITDGTNGAQPVSTATPLFKGVKPNPLAFRSTGYLSKRSKSLGSDFSIPETPSKKAHSKVLVQFTPQNVQSSLISKKSEGLSGIFDMSSSSSIDMMASPAGSKKPATMLGKLKKSPSMEISPVLEKKKKMDNSPMETPKSLFFSTPFLMQSSSPPYESQLSPPSPSSPLGQKPIGFRSFSSPVKETYKEELDSSFVHEDPMLLEAIPEEEQVQWRDFDEDSRIMEEDSMAPSFLFGQRQSFIAAESPFVVTEESSAINSEGNLGSSNAAAMILGWRTTYAHQLDQKYFELDEEEGKDDNIYIMKALSQLQNGSYDESDYFFEQFEILQVLGKGSFADVYLVRWKQDNLLYAVKKTRHPFQGIKDRAKKLNEVASLWKVSKCPNVLRVINAWEQYGYLYVQTEVCSNGSLLDVIENHDLFSEEEIVTVLKHLAVGLGHIHELGIAHLDLKPANVLVDVNGTLKIGDFGLATLVGQKADREGDKVYMAPELLQGQFSTAADIYSLGLIALEMAANIALPSQGEEWQRLRTGDFSDIPFEIERSAPLMSLIHAMIQPIPSTRPSADEILLSLH